MSTTPPTSPSLFPLEAKNSLETIATARKRPHEEMFESSRPIQKSRDLPLHNQTTSGSYPPSPKLESDASLQEPKESADSGKANLGHEHDGAADEPDKREPEQAFDPRQEIETFDWQGLESRYLMAMAEQDDIQAALQDEFRRRMEFFGIWAQSAVVHENGRAHKRLKTRMHYVQRTERDLFEKREHYTKVVKAFESALALLGGT